MKNMFEVRFTKRKDLLWVCLLILVGTILIVVGAVFNPSFVAGRLSPDGVLDKTTLVRVYVFEALSIGIGLIVCFYSLLKIAKSVLAKKIDEKVETYVIHPWNRYWFTPTSLRRLAIFRILIFGFLVFMSLFIWIPDFIELLKHASPEFFKPLLLIRILHLSPPSSPFVLDVIYFLLIIFAAGATIGFRTRFCMFGSLVLFLYIVGMWWSFEGIHRSIAPAYIFAMTGLLLSPCGKVLSVDEILARVKNSERRGEFQRDRIENLRSEYALWPIRLTQVFIAYSYFNAGYWKLKVAGLSWASGTSLQFYLIDHHLRGSNITDVGLFMSQFPILCKSLSVLTLTFELGFPMILVFPRLAWIFLPAGVLFHVGTGLTMATWFYPLWFSYVAFINFESLGAWVKYKLRVSHKSGEIKVLYDGACTLCIRSMTFIACLDWLKRIEFVDVRMWEEVIKFYPSLKKEDCLSEMYVIDQDSQIHKGFFAYRRLAGVLPIFWILLPFLYLPGISLIGERTYHWVANRRSRDAVACGIHNCK